MDTELLNEIITVVLKVLIGIACTLITTKLIPWLKTKFENNELSMTKKIIATAVKAAEQLYNTDEGQAKLVYAKNIVIAALAAKNIKLNEEVLNGYIEAAVLELHNDLKEITDESSI